jgi:hypothetical protein
LIAGMRMVHADPVVRQKKSAATKKRWDDPSTREKILAGTRAAGQRRRNRDTAEAPAGAEGTAATANSRRIRSSYPTP